LRFERISGLDEEQLGELECRVAELLEEPWDKDEGRPRELTLREALVVTCGYLRQNIIEDGVLFKTLLRSGLRQSHVIMAGCCGDTPGLAFSRPGW
jgi:hypothetical protein